jgi:hypothetical protein
MAKVLSSICLYLLEDRPVLLPLLPDDFLPLFGAVDHEAKAGVAVVSDLAELGVGVEVVEVPVVEFLHVSDAVDASVRLQQEGVLREEARADNPPLVFLGLEVRVGEADEDLLNAVLGKVVAKVLHAVRPYHADVVVLPRVKHPERPDLFRHVIDWLVPDLQTEDEFGGELRRQSE